MGGAGGGGGLCCGCSETHPPDAQGSGSRHSTRTSAHSRRAGRQEGLGEQQNLALQDRQTGTLTAACQERAHRAVTVVAAAGWQLLEWPRAIPSLPLPGHALLRNVKHCCTVRRMFPVFSPSRPPALPRSTPAPPPADVDEQSKNEIKDILLTYDRTLLVADPRRCEPKK